MRPALALPACLVLAACSALVPGTMVELSALSPLTADPSAIEVALVLPPGLEVAPNSAILTLGATHRVTGETVSETFVLQPMSSQAGGAGLPDDPGAERFRLSPADLDRMEQTQNDIEASNALLPDAVRGSLSVGLGGCAKGEGPAPDAKAAAFIRTERNGAFLPLIRETPLLTLLGRDLFDAIGPCTDPG